MKPDIVRRGEGKSVFLRVCMCVEKKKGGGGVREMESTDNLEP